MSSVIVVKYGVRRAVIAAGLRGAPGTGGGGSTGVSSFNARTGAVTLTGADVTGALAYTPANNASLAAVAFSGAYADLSGRPSLAAVALSGAYADLSGSPFIPAAPGDIGAATASQGALADTAVQPAALTVQLDLKVDKIAGYGLSQENFTAAEKAKLAGLDGPLWKGTYIGLAALQSAHPTAEPGSSAHVDAGVGDPVKVYNWDASDGEWVAGGGDAAPVTAAQVKLLYESNADTNAYTNSEKSKLGSVAANATANPNTDSLAEGVSPTNKWFTEARVRAALATGLSFADSTVISATDSFLQILGKLAARLALAFDRANHSGSQATSTVTGLDAALAKALYAPVITEATTSRVLALTDGAAYIRHTNASASTVTIPPQSSVVWLAETEIHIRRAAAANLTLTPGSGVTLNAPSGGTLVLTNAMSVTLKRVAADVWDVIGQTVPA